MARRITPSQLRSKIRQQQAKTKQALRKIQQAARKAEREAKRAVDDYNRKVRQHNAKVRSDGRRLKQEVARISRPPSPKRVVRVKTTTRVVQSSFLQVERRLSKQRLSAQESKFLELARREAENSAWAYQVLSGEAPESADEQQLNQSGITHALRTISGELADRWAGALFALNPRNPDAARHFCTSIREVFVEILESHAPDEQVLVEHPDPKLTPQGRPTRRSRIEVLLNRGELSGKDVIGFVDDDIEDILALFRAFNDGTHGSAGRFSTAELLSLKRRAEDGISFLTEIITPARSS